MLNEINENRRNIILAAHREVVAALIKQGVSEGRAEKMAVPATAKVASNMIGVEISGETVMEVLGL